MTHTDQPARASVPALVLHRTYPVPRERVFAAWTDPATIVRFFSPGEMKATNANVDLRVGGAFGLTMIAPDGEPFIAHGVYREVVAPARLVMTWRWEEENPADEHESLLTLDFADENGATAFTLTHEELASLESRDRHTDGWTSIADKLDEILTTEAGS